MKLNDWDGELRNNMASSGLIKWFARINENIENSRCEEKSKKWFKKFSCYYNSATLELFLHLRNIIACT